MSTICVFLASVPILVNECPIYDGVIRFLFSKAHIAESDFISYQLARSGGGKEREERRTMLMLHSEEFTLAEAESYIPRAHFHAWSARLSADHCTPSWRAQPAHNHVRGDKASPACFYLDPEGSTKRSSQFSAAESKRRDGTRLAGSAQRLTRWRRGKGRKVGDR